MMDYIVFSKNRAMQLNLHLQLALTHIKNINKIYILYTHTNDMFKKAYNKLKDKKHSKVVWILESNFKRDLITLLDTTKSEYFLAFADDDYIIKDTQLDLILHFLDDKRIQSASLKFSDQLKYNSVNQKPMVLPDFIKQDTYLLWDWTKQNAQQDWGYPMALTGTIFQKTDIESYIKDFQYTNLGILEALVNHHRNYTKPLMISFNETKVVTLPLNRVITTATNPHDNISPELLNQKYLAGYNIDKHSIEQIEPKKSFFIYNTKLRYNRENYD